MVISPTTQIVTHEIAQEYLDLIEVGTDLPLHRVLDCVTLTTNTCTEKFTPPKPCSSLPKHGEKYKRRCPDPDVIFQFLKHTTNFKKGI